AGQRWPAGGGAGPVGRGRQVPAAADAARGAAGAARVGPPGGLGRCGCCDRAAGRRPLALAGAAAARPAAERLPGWPRGPAAERVRGPLVRPPERPAAAQELRRLGEPLRGRRRGRSVAAAREPRHGEAGRRRRQRGGAVGARGARRRTALATQAAELLGHGPEAVLPAGSGVRPASPDGAAGPRGRRRGRPPRHLAGAARGGRARARRVRGAGRQAAAAGGRAAGARGLGRGAVGCGVGQVPLQPAAAEPAALPAGLGPRGPDRGPRGRVGARVHARPPRPGAVRRRPRGRPLLLGARAHPEGAPPGGARGRPRRGGRAAARPGGGAGPRRLGGEGGERRGRHPVDRRAVAGQRSPSGRPRERCDEGSAEGARGLLHVRAVSDRERRRDRGGDARGAAVLALLRGPARERRGLRPLRRGAGGAGRAGPGRGDGVRLAAAARPRRLGPHLLVAAPRARAALKNKIVSLLAYSRSV
ncbi:unnamed protein product, partial [Prorocentrum cordatum]